ncbi:alpha/beta fold hydrolase [Glutamicibacter halophytocola]|uniref:alpha/beta fold hydrolase n=1 Tax=Glutamicibacter halophytocola TaxID=1933880 RepID=UPI0015597244|nr:alpha/beta hydrolase [Glutamicibacter halophytocola]NQD42412.1 alpha/beta hydrolase [Glutamicibacter halophytocola]
MTVIPDSSPVVLLHGWPVTENHWRHLVPVLGKAGYSIIPITLPGLGAAPEGSQSFRKTDLAMWVRNELARQGITRFALIGHDWGATVAALLTAELGSAVTALVVEEEILPGIDIDIPAPGRDYYPTWHGSFNSVPGLADHLVPTNEAVFYGEFLAQSAGPPRIDDEAVNSYIQAYSRSGVLEAGLSYYRTRSGDVADVRRLLTGPLMKTPVLAIGGRYAMGSAVAEGMRLLATNVNGLVFNSSGHYPLEQEPIETSQAILAFLHRYHSTEKHGLSTKPTMLSRLKTSD